MHESKVMVPMKVLITGSSGDVGSHLVRDFGGKGCVVRTLDLREADFPSSTVAVENRFTGSVADKELVDKAVDGAEFVIHLAWSFSDQPGEVWEIGWEKAAEDLGYRPALGREDGLASLKRAIAAPAESLDGNKK